MVRLHEISELEIVWRGYRERAERTLDNQLPLPTEAPARLHEAMRYVCLGGGKRLRAMLVYATGAALGADASSLDAPACAVELVHAYSLVHDDLPAMDDDNLRRGRPTCHRAYDEATAVLVGDGLQALAFEVLAKTSMPHIDATRRAAMLTRLAEASGSRGMVGGQALDLAAAGQQLGIDDLQHMHLKKTGALIRASVALGALGAATVTPQTLASLDNYARCIGLAFQIVDDILDEEGETELLGKMSGADRALNKSTYPAALGLDGARATAHDLHRQALQSLRRIDGDTTELSALANFIVERNH